MKSEVEKIKSEEKLIQIINEYDKLVFSICYRITNDCFIAEDLAQETFLQVYRQFHTFDGKNEKAWIARIATNKSIDYIRSTNIRMIPTNEEQFLQLIEPSGNPETICIEREIHDHLMECCDKLKPPYDEVARQFFIEERSASKIAKLKGIKLKTVQTQIYRAKALLKKNWKGEV